MAGTQQIKSNLICCLENLSTEMNAADVRMKWASDWNVLGEQKIA